jgi:hypothetical protein
MITQAETNEDATIRALTDREIEDVNGGLIAVLIPLACFAVGVAVGVTIAK